MITQAVSRGSFSHSLIQWKCIEHLCAQHTVKHVTGYKLEYDTRVRFSKDHCGSIVEDGMQRVDRGRRLAWSQGTDSTTDGVRSF